MASQDIVDGIVDDLTRIAIKAAVRLIQQQQIRGNQADPGELRTPTHTRRTTSSHSTGNGREANTVELQIDLTVPAAEQIRDQPKVLVQGQIGMERCVVANQGHSIRPLWWRSDRRTEHLTVAIYWLNQPRKKSQQGGLAAAVVAFNGDALVRQQTQRQVA